MLKAALQECQMVWTYLKESQSRPMALESRYNKFRYSIGITLQARDTHRTNML